MRRIPPVDLRSGAAVAACVLAYLAAAAFILVAPPQPGLFSDALDYLALSDFFHGHLYGEPSVLGAQAFNHTRFPPLFPLQLALFGVDLHATGRAYAVTLGTGLLAVLACLAWLRQATGSTLAAAGLVAVGVLTPRMFLFLLEVQSELLFLLLLVGSLLLAAGYREGKASLLVLCAVSALLPLCRMAGLAAVLALGLWLLCLPGSGRWRRLAGCALMLLPGVCWLLFRRQYPVAIDYLADLHHFDPAALAWLKEAGGRLVEGLAAQFTLYPGPVVRAAMVGLLLLAACGWWQRLRAWQADALVLPASLLLTLVWPYPAEDPRLLAVSMPLLGLCAWQGAGVCQRWLAPRFPARWPALVAGLPLLLAWLTASPFWWQTLQRATASGAPELASEQRSSTYFTAPERVVPVALEIMRRVRLLMAEVPRVVPRGECVWATLPGFAGYHANFGSEFRPMPDGLSGHPDPAPRLAGCKYVLVVNLNASPTYAGPLYPLATIRAFSQPLLVSRFNWDGKETLAAALLRLEPGSPP